MNSVRTLQPERIAKKAYETLVPHGVSFEGRIGGVELVEEEEDKSGGGRALQYVKFCDIEGIEVIGSPVGDHCSINERSPVVFRGVDRLFQEARAMGIKPGNYQSDPFTARCRFFCNGSIVVDFLEVEREKVVSV